MLRSQQQCLQATGRRYVIDTLLRIGTRDELKQQGVLVVSGSDRPLVVLYHQDRLCAIDNACDGGGSSPVGEPAAPAAAMGDLFGARKGPGLTHEPLDPAPVFKFDAPDAQW